MATHHRCRPLRVESSEILWFVSTRTIEERFWLLALIDAGRESKHNRATRRAIARYERQTDKRVARLVARINASRGPYQAKLDVQKAKLLLRDYVGAAIARGQQKYGVRIHAIVVMGNHLHLVLSTPHKNLRSFMGYVKARIADGTNFFHGRRGPLWARRYDAEPILDDESATDRVVYTVCNPPQADLVDAAEEWPGLCVAHGLRGVTSMTFRYFDRTAWHRAGRPEEIAPHIETATLELSPLPEMEGRSVAEIGKLISKLVEQREDRERERRRAAGRTVLGLDGLRSCNFDQRPARPKRSRRPYCHAACVRRRAKHLRDMNDLHQSYASSARRFLAGDLEARFPPGTYPPPLPAAA